MERFVKVSEAEIKYFAEAQLQENTNTKKKTLSDINLFKQFLGTEDEQREIGEIPTTDLQELAITFVLGVRKKNGEEYEPSSIRGFLQSVDRYLRKQGYKLSLLKDKEFSQLQDILKKKQKQLKAIGKGNDSPFYLAINTEVPKAGKKWFKASPLGVNSMVKNMTAGSQLHSDKKLVNHSTTKHLVQKLVDNDIPPNEIVQMISEERKTNLEKEKKQAEDMRAKALEKVGETRKRVANDDGSGEPEKKEKRGRRSGTETMSCLKENSEKEFQIRKAELELKKKEQYAPGKLQEEMTQQMIRQQQQQQQTMFANQLQQLSQMQMAVMQQQQQQSVVLLALLQEFAKKK